ncbi:MAG: SH3 domain-containing protein [Bauldia sp.]
MLKIATTLLLAAVTASPALATSGPGCLVVVNVARNDALNVRAAPSSSARIVDVLPPGRHGIIHLDADCTPKSQPWASRWCPITHYNGDSVRKGWIKARYVRDSDCP